MNLRKFFKIPSKQEILWYFKWHSKIIKMLEEYQTLDKHIWYIQLMDGGDDMYIKKEKIKAINKHKNFEIKLHKIIELYNQNTVLTHNFCKIK